MAGLIAEQTKQAINGFPGLTQLPVLGAVPQPRPVNSQTELMVLVTPMSARGGAGPVASGRRLCQYVGSAGRSAGQHQSHLRRSGPDRSQDGIIAAPMALLRTEAGTMTQMTSTRSADPSAPSTLTAALIGISVVLGACNPIRELVMQAERPQRLSPASPRSRCRKPIARSWSSSGADAAAFCHAARRRDGAGTGLDARGHRRDQRRRAGRYAKCAGGPRPCARSGPPSRRPVCRRARPRSPSRPEDPRHAGGDPAELSEDFGGGRSMRPVAGDLDPRSTTELVPEQAPATVSAAPTSATTAAMVDNADGPGAAASRNSRLSCRGVASPSRNIAGASPPRPPIPVRQGQTQRHRQMISYARQNTRAG